jgi:T5SS/PEP-CTERM-associated repeat protein
MGLSVARHGSKGLRAPLRVALMASTALLSSAVTAQAQQAWTAATSNNWFTGSNWSTNSAPGNGDQPTIDTTTPNPAVVDGGAAGGPATASLGQVVVGNSGTGTLTVQNGGTLTTDKAFIGNNAGSNGTATVTGAGSSWSNSGTIFVGNAGAGIFNVFSGATFTSSDDTFLGYSAGSTGTLNVDGAGSKFSLATGKTLYVGASGLSGLPSGTGIVNVTNGGTLDMNGTLTLLGVSGGTGTMNFDASTWNPGQTVVVGFSGSGAVNIANGSVATVNGIILVGDCSCATGIITVTGAGSQFTSINGADVVVGGGGTGAFNVLNGATATLLSGLVLGQDAGSSGTVTVQNGSTFTTDRGNITIGQNGSGTFNVFGGSTFIATQGTGPSADAFVGFAAGGTGTLNVDGAGSSWSLPNGILHVGSSGFGGPAAGTGTVNVTNGATLAPSSAAIGVNGGTGTVNVNASTLTTGNLGVGISGTGTLNITNGGVGNVSAQLLMGDCDCSVGTITVSGAGSQFNSTSGNPNDVAIGVDGTAVFNVLKGAAASFATDVGVGVGNGSGTVNVQSGGTFSTAASLIVGFGRLGTVNVTGPGSAVNATDIFVGEGGTGIVNVTNGGQVNLTGTTFIADCGCTVGTVTVSGAGSAWTSALGTTIGVFGTGQFNVLDGATVNLGPVFLGTGPGTGTLKIDATSQATVAGGSYTQGSGGTLNVGISPTSNGKVTVTGGDIDLTNGGAGNGALVVNAKTTVAKTYTIMTTDGAVIGGFSGVSVVGNANNLQVLYGVSCGAGCSAVQLTVDTFSVANNLPSGLTGNPKHVADALDKAIASGLTIPDPFFNVFALSGGSLVKALSQLSGEPAAGAEQSNIQLMNSFMALLLNPFSGALNDNPGAIGPARAFGPGEQISPEAAAAYAAVTPKDKRVAPFAARWTVWGQAYGGYNTTNGDTSSGSHNSTARTYGLATGFDYRSSADTMVGFALAGGGESWGLSDGLGGGHGEALQLGVYGTKQYGAAYLSGSLAYAAHNITTDRTVTVAGSDQLRANFTAQSVGGRIETGYRFLTPYAGVTPYAALQLQGFFTPSYGENAVSGTNAFALAYGARSSLATRTELGAWFDKTLALEDDKVLSLRLRTAWANDHQSDQAIGASFQTLPGASFTVNGAKPATNLALVTAGAELKLANNVSVGVKFDGEFAGVSQTYAGTGVVRRVW